MTNPDDTTTDQPVVDLDAPADTDTDTDTGGGGNSEAAKYRVQLRAKETELRAKETEHTILQAKVDSMVRAEIQRVAADTLSDGADFWREEVDLADLCDEDGLPDANKVRAHADSLVAAHAHWKRKTPPKTPPASAVTGGSPYDSAPKPSWVTAITGRAGG